MKATTVDKILLSSIPSHQITISEKSGDFCWDELFPQIQSNWDALRRSKERALPGVVVAAYRFERSPSQYFKFEARVTNEQWNAAREFAQQHVASTTDKWVNALSGVRMKKPLFNNPKLSHEQKLVFWRQLPGSYGSTQ